MLCCGLLIADSSCSTNLVSRNEYSCIKNAGGLVDRCAALLFADREEQNNPCCISPLSSPSLLVHRSSFLLEGESPLPDRANRKSTCLCLSLGLFVVVVGHFVACLLLLCEERTQRTAGQLLGVSCQIIASVCDDGTTNYSTPPSSSSRQTLPGGFVDYCLSLEDQIRKSERKIGVKERDLQCSEEPQRVESVILGFCAGLSVLCH